MLDQRSDVSTTNVPNPCTLRGPPLGASASFFRFFFDTIQSPVFSQVLDGVKNLVRLCQ